MDRSYGTIVHSALTGKYAGRIIDIGTLTIDRVRRSVAIRNIMIDRGSVTCKSGPPTSDPR